VVFRFVVWACIFSLFKFFRLVCFWFMVGLGWE